MAAAFIFIVVVITIVLLIVTEPLLQHIFPSSGRGDLPAPSSEMSELGAWVNHISRTSLPSGFVLRFANKHTLSEEESLGFASPVSAVGCLWKGPPLCVILAGAVSENLPFLAIRGSAG